jgi:hypothetical protein
VFLGDLVDRGPYSLEIVLFLYSLKVFYLISLSLDKLSKESSVAEGQS